MCAEPCLHLLAAAPCFQKFSEEGREALCTSFIHVSHIAVVLIAGGIEIFRQNQIEVIEFKSGFCKQGSNLCVGLQVIL